MRTFRLGGGSQAVSHSIGGQEAHPLQQDRTGPFDGELLDLYVSLLIAVPFGFFLKSLFF